MLMDIKCSMIPSIKVELTFDDGHKKDPTLGIGDLIDLLYNSNGLRKHIVGRIIQINTPGHDPKGWSFIVDGSDDFESEVARLSPMSILDVDVIRKNGTTRVVSTPIDDTGICAIRINKGRLQYSRDGKHWRNIKIDDVDIINTGEEIIIDENGRIDPTGEGPGRHGNNNVIIDEN
jgi:hypothetical protein